MLTRSLPRTLVLSIPAIVVLLPISAYSQLGLSKLKGDKEEKREQKEEKQKTEEAKQYATLSEYAQHLYDTDADFKESVDVQYKDLLSRQAQIAYDINTRPASTTSVPLDVSGGVYVLYNNPRIQDYVNRLGQQLVPAGSDKLYAFRIIASPVPCAFTLATGSVYISTGLVSLTDNEAQLAYTLEHEVDHVAKDHWKMKIMDAMAESEYNQKQERKRAIWGAILGAAVGTAIGAGAGQSGRAAAEGGAIGAVAGGLFGALTAKRFGVDWNSAQENEADDFALRNALNRNYDVQEVPKLYMTLNAAVAGDARVGLGFISSPARIKDRLAYAQRQLQSASFKTDYEKKLNAGQLIGTGPNYERMMAELKRDNGIWALDFDMFGMAKQNLEQAVSLRTDDARAHLFYGEVVKLVGRTDKDRQLADAEFVKAIQLDALRHRLAPAQLQHALVLMDTSGSEAEAAQALKSYIQDYQATQLEEAKYADSVPSNLDVLYDYLRQLGDQKWKPAPPPAEYYELTLARAGTTEGQRVADARPQPGRTSPALPVMKPVQEH